MVSKLVIVLVSVVIAAVVAYFGRSGPGLKDRVQDTDKWWGAGVRKETDSSIKPFTYSASDEALQDLKDRLSKTRYFEQLEGSSWERGVPINSTRDLAQYWMTKFDWRAQEKEIFKYNHFTTNINGIDIHFVHVKSQVDRKAVTVTPLLMLHGWPSSFVQFLDMIPYLTVDYFKNNTAFDVVIPSLPGFGFSEQPHKPGCDTIEISFLLMKLMNRLHYKKYIVQGGDWGSYIAKNMATYDQEHCVGIHLNMWHTSFTAQIVLETAIANYVPQLSHLSPWDRSKVSPFYPTKLGFLIGESGHVHEHMTKPSTIATGLGDSPAGLMAYIYEKMQSWRDHDPVSCQSCPFLLTNDQVLTTVTLYWLTNSIFPSVNLYYNTIPYGNTTTIALQLNEVITVPTALADFPGEIIFSHFPQRWVNWAFPNIIQYSYMPKGGHFANFEVPADFSGDIHKFAALLAKM